MYNSNWKSDEWYVELSDAGKHIFDLIIKYHSYFRKQDKKYQRIVRSMKIIILLLAMASTIILGLRAVIAIDLQVVIGLILSSLITFITAVSSYFNFEEYWMRNISIHIELNILRDNFMYDANDNKLDSARIEFYRGELEKIQRENIRYWAKAIKRV